MKKTNNYLHFTFFLLLLISVLCLGACENPTHENQCSHESVEWIIDKNPSCTETGARHQICNDCEATLLSETIEKTKHVEELVASVAATCTQDGLTAGKKCSNCNTVLVPQEVVFAKAHSEITIAGKKASCTETGLTDGKKCSVCGVVTVEPQVISLQDHDESGWITDENAAVGINGLKHKECLSCGKTLATEVIPALEETHVHAGSTWSIVKPATCTAAGIKNLLCSCGITIDTDVIPIAPHTEEIIPAVDADCMSTGLTAGKKCSECGEILIKQSPTAKGKHKEEPILGFSASCTVPGLTDGKKCSVCSTVTHPQQIIPAAGHDFSDGVCKNCGISEPYGIWIVDGQGNPITDVIVKIMQNGEQIKMYPYKGEFLSMNLEPGSYQISLDLSQLNETYVFDASACVITPEKKTTTVRLFKTVGERTDLFVGYPIELDYPAYFVSEGATSLSLTAGDYSFFVFEPKVAAIYTFTYECSANLTISYHGSTFFTQGTDLTGNSDDVMRYENGISINVYASNLGASYVIGIMSDTASECILHIRNSGDPGTRIEDEPWTPYLEDEDKVAADLAVEKNGTYTAIDLTDLTIKAVYNESDGYYHLGTADGPIIFIDLTSSTSYISSIQIISGNQRIGVYIYDANGNVVEKRSYNELFHQYGMPDTADATVSDPVRVPLTAKLAEAIQNFGNKNGWWDPNSTANILIPNLLGAPYNQDYAWLLFCGYYN